MPEIANNMFEAVENWQRLRLGKFTASEIHKLLKGGTRPMTEEELKVAKAEKNRRTTVDTLFGDGATTYIEEILSEILTGEAKDDISTLKALQWGAAHEHEGVAAFTSVIKKDVEYYGVSEPRFFEYNMYSGGSPDGMVAGKSVLEMKCPYVTSKHLRFLKAAKNGASNEWLKDNNEDYYTQVQFNMMCASKILEVPIEHAYFCSYSPRPVEEKHRLAVIQIYVDKDFQDNIHLRLQEAANRVADDLILLG